MEQDIKKFFAFLVPWSFVCSFLGSFYYWRTVNINQFDFISFQDLISSAALFLIYAAITILVTWALERIMDHVPIMNARDSLSPERVKPLYIKLVLSLVVFIGLLLSGVYDKQPAAYSLITPLILTYTAQLRNTPFIQSLFNFSSSSIALAATLVLVMAPVGVLLIAKISSSVIINESEYTYVESSNLKEPTIYKKPQRLLYYGKLNNFMFFLVEGSLVAFPTDAFHRFEFKKYRKSKETSPVAKELSPTTKSEATNIKASSPTQKEVTSATKAQDASPVAKELSPTTKGEATGAKASSPIPTEDASATKAPSPTNKMDGK